MSRPLSPIERMVVHDRLLEFETLVPMTVSERSALRRWVKGGHDINSNPWNFYDADGWEMSYLEAFRMDLAEYELKTLSYAVFFKSSVFEVFFTQKNPCPTSGQGLTRHLL